MFRQAEFNPARATKAPIMDDRAAARRCGEERTAPNWPTNDAVCCHSPHPKRCTKPMGLRAIGTLRVVGRANALRRIAEAAPRGSAGCRAPAQDRTLCLRCLGKAHLARGWAV